jgi:Flp pilus assembly protein TadD
VHPIRGQNLNRSEVRTFQPHDLWKHGPHGDSEREIRKAIRLNRRYAQAHNDLGDMYLSQGEHLRAESEFKKAIMLALITLAEAHCGRGAALWKLGMSKEAEKELQEALRLRANYFQARSILAQVLKEKKEESR